MVDYNTVKKKLRLRPGKWLVTGAAGFIGSNLVEALLKLDQNVTGLDNFSTGYQYNLDEVQKIVSREQWERFSFVKGDICDVHTCLEVCKNQDFVLHQAALGSVPRSVKNPLVTNKNNITGFLNMLVAARDARVKQFVYAASSSTYGDHDGLPKVEGVIGKPLSPYAVTKYVNELYADVFARTYDFKTIGLRYFNLFGKRQDPIGGGYAAVIPLWFAGLIKGSNIFINGDGETSRDFCFIDNCVQANILAATVVNEDSLNQVYNVAFGERTTLNQLFKLIKERVGQKYAGAAGLKPEYRDFRPGDVRHSLADISKARDLLGYSPGYSIEQGLDIACEWYMEKLK